MSDSGMPSPAGSRTQEMLNAFKQAGVQAKAEAKEAEASVPQEEAETYEYGKPLDEPEAPSLSEEDKQETAEGQPDSQESSEESQDAKAKSEAIEEIIVSDDKGKRKVKIDFNDRAKIKKAYEMAYGMRKFQAERDAVKKELAEIQSKQSELQDAWDAIEKAYQDHGVEGLLSTLLESEDAYQQHVDSIIKRARLREEASPDELRRLEAEERAEQAERRAEQLLKKQEEEAAKQAETRAKTEQAALQAVVDPAFKKWSFDGKLGDAELEQQYDEALWNLSMKRLRALPDDVELDKQTIDNTFREVASKFRKAVQSSAKKTAETAIQRKKDAAATKAKAVASQGRVTSQRIQEFDRNLKSGNLTAALKDVLTGRVKIKR